MYVYVYFLYISIPDAPRTEYLPTKNAPFFWGKRKDIFQHHGSSGCK